MPTKENTSEEGPPREKKPKPGSTRFYIAGYSAKRNQTKDEATENEWKKFQKDKKYWFISEFNDEDYWWWRYRK